MAPRLPPPSSPALDWSGLRRHRPQGLHDRRQAGERARGFSVQCRGSGAYEQAFVIKVGL